MGARSKLNVAYVYAAVIIAALIGGVCQSWAVFFVAATLLVAGSIVAGEIRPTPRR